MHRLMVYGRQSDQYRQRRNGQNRADQVADGVEVFIAIGRRNQWIGRGFLQAHKPSITYHFPFTHWEGAGG